MSDSLDRLKNLTPSLPSLPSMILSEGRGHVIEYRTDDGVSVAVGLHKSGDVAVCRAVNSAGYFPEHSHQEHETVVIVEGVAIYHLPDGDIEIGPGQSIYIAPDVPHSTTFVVTTRLIAITVPAAEGFPDGG